MGRDPAREENVEAWEQPPHELTLPTYYIARYPVTVTQFRAFCSASDYQPQDADSLRDPANRAVRYVAWYQALQYCAWLTETLRAWAGTPDPLATLLRTGADSSPPWRITLPSEADWEKATRGTEGRIYPWGNKPDRQAANWNETGKRHVCCGGIPWRCRPLWLSRYGGQRVGVDMQPVGRRLSQARLWLSLRSNRWPWGSHCL